MRNGNDDAYVKAFVVDEFYDSVAENPLSIFIKRSSQSTRINI